MSTTFLVLFAVVQIGFWCLFFCTITFHESKEPHQFFPTVTVLICAKNEKISLSRGISAILNQNYPSFEIIVMDDYSTDGTSKMLNQFSEIYSNIHLLKPSKDVIGKKIAVQEGVERASSEWILMTDADCQPLTKNWIKIMMSKAVDSKDVIIGYGRYKNENTLLNSFIRYETLYIAFQYYTAAIRGNAYMAVGRNLAFRRSAFLKHHPFENSEYSAGDDDDIIHALSEIKNVAVVLEPESHTISIAKNTFANYFDQKRRHVSPSVSYPFLQQLILGVLAFSHLGFYAFFTICLFNENLCVPLLVLLVRWIIMMIFMKKLSKILNEENLVTITPLADLFLAFFYFLQFFFIPFPKKNW